MQQRGKRDKCGTPERRNQLAAFKKESGDLKTNIAALAKDVELNKISQLGSAIMEHSAFNKHLQADLKQHKLDRAAAEGSVCTEGRWH